MQTGDPRPKSARSVSTNKSRKREPVDRNEKITENQHENYKKNLEELADTKYNHLSKETRYGKAMGIEKELEIESEKKENEREQKEIEENKNDNKGENEEIRKIEGNSEDSEEINKEDIDKCLENYEKSVTVSSKASWKTTSSQRRYIEELESLLREEKLRRIKLEEILNHVISK